MEKTKQQKKGLEEVVTSSHLGRDGQNLTGPNTITRPRLLTTLPFCKLASLKENDECDQRPSFMKDPYRNSLAFEDATITARQDVGTARHKSYHIA